MKTYIILFRGINVGGNNILPMKSLVPLLIQHNLQNVASYIQSGNVVLDSENNPKELIQKIVLDNFGFSPELFIFTEGEFTTAKSKNPYQTFEGKFVHCYFCHGDIKLNQEKVNKYLASFAEVEKSENYTVKDKVFYLYAPNGIGRSKLVANIEACLGQSATGRNLNTVNKISSMLKKG
ncbi:DUF1697 domain-containing protein [Colwellia sp. E2M01]|uniref:DUF1697 domain-containing protein n=1 Tax=Colwellia sp. E2M01 TaxID=2841561 RepID=UPI001C09CA99|nr:DUF1697 domain-containing protein [Colwellia sp. E2M01]MBU2871065.1 DUF1697 domain-containing protein [Colwellia sp. E2M01]